LSEDNYILAYYQAIKSGRETAGKWIHAIYEYIIKGLQEKAFYFDVKKANTAVEWIENNCFHTEGPLAPGPFHLELWEKAFISCLYGIVNENGLRLPREVLLVVGRKNGKSQLAACIAKYEWFQYGGYGAKIYTIAPKLDQADIIYNNIWQQVVIDPSYKAQQKQLDELRGQRTATQRAKRIIEEMPRHRMSDLYLPSNNGTVKKIAFSAKKSDGFNPSFCVCDEVAAWEGDQGLKQYEVLKSGMGARPEGLLLSCTTSGYINDSIFDELMKRATRFLMGDSKETKFFPFIYMIDDVEKWNDINELRKSNPNLGVSVSVDFMLEEIAIAEGSLSKKGEFLTKYCCIKQNSSLAFLRAQDIERAVEPGLKIEDFGNRYAVVGVDLSQTTDLTAVTTVIQENGLFYIFGKFFLPAEKIEEATLRDGVPYDIYIQKGFLQLSGDNYINYRDVYDYLVWLVENLKIYPLRVGYDRYSAQYLIQDLNNYGFVTDDVFQGWNLWPVIQEFEGLIKDGKIKFDNDLLKIHFLNTAVKMNAERGRGQIIKLNPSAHIDGMAATLDAFTMRAKYHDEIGEQLKNGTF
jgi:phage terminase large subunit-like protein